MGFWGKQNEKMRDFENHEKCLILGYFGLHVPYFVEGGPKRCQMVTPGTEIVEACLRCVCGVLAFFKAVVGSNDSGNVGTVGQEVNHTLPDHYCCQPPGTQSNGIFGVCYANAEPFQAVRNTTKVFLFFTTVKHSVYWHCSLRYYLLLSPRSRRVHYRCSRSPV